MVSCSGPRFTPTLILLCLGYAAGKLLHMARLGLVQLGVPFVEDEQLRDAVLKEKERNALFLDRPSPLTAARIPIGMAGW